MAVVFTVFSIAMPLMQHQRDREFLREQEKTLQENFNQEMEVLIWYATKQGKEDL